VEEVALNTPQRFVSEHVSARSVGPVTTPNFLLDFYWNQRILPDG
jgi:hypothetical protein